MSQWGWRLFQIGIIFLCSRIPEYPGEPHSSGSAALFGILVAALATGLLAALFRLVRRALGRESVEDRQWREWKGPRSPLDLRSARD